MPTLEELIEETQRVMSRNLAQELYGDNALTACLGHEVKRRTRIKHIRSWAGRIFLKLANNLGEYNDDY